MRTKIIGLTVVLAVLAAACTPAAGSAEWCKGIVDGTVKATPEEMLANSDKCAAHELAG